MEKENAKEKSPMGGDEIKIFVEVTESQYNQIKKMLADTAESERNLNRLILLVKSALTFGHGEKVFIKTNDAAKELLDFVWSITEGF